MSENYGDNSEALFKEKELSALIMMQKNSSIRKNINDDNSEWNEKWNVKNEKMKWKNSASELENISIIS